MRTPGRMDTSDVKAHQCQTCGRTVDAVTGAGPDEGEPIRPSVGDLIICLYCGTVEVMLIDGYRLATTEECAELPPLAREWLRSRIGVIQ